MPVAVNKPPHSFEILDDYFDAALHSARHQIVPKPNLPSPPKPTIGRPG